MATVNSYNVGQNPEESLMPTPERTTTAAIVAAARAIVEAGGAGSLTMKEVATRVGVRAPSLYKRVRDRNDLIRLVVEDTVDEIGVRLQAAADRTVDPRAAVVAMADALRALAHERPQCYQLTFGPLPPGARPERGTLERVAGPVLEMSGRLAGEDHALEAARTLTAWMNGFIQMELSGAFRLGGDVDAAYAWGLAALIEAITNGGERRRD